MRKLRSYMYVIFCLKLHIEPTLKETLLKNGGSSGMSKLKSRTLTEKVQITRSLTCITTLYNYSYFMVTNIVFLLLSSIKKMYRLSVH